MSGYVIEHSPKRDLPGRPFMLALFIVCLLLAGGLNEARKTIDARTEEQVLQPIRVQTQALINQTEKAVVNPMTKRMLKQREAKR